MTNQTNIDDELRKTIENDLARFVQEHLDTWCRDVLSTADHAGIERLNACSLLAYWLTSMASKVTAFGGGMSPQSFGEWCAEIHEAALKRNPAALATGGDVK